MTFSGPYRVVSNNNHCSYRHCVEVASTINITTIVESIEICDVTEVYLLMHARWLFIKQKSWSKVRQIFSNITKTMTELLCVAFGYITYWKSVCVLELNKLLELCKVINIFYLFLGSFYVISFSDFHQIPCIVIDTETCIYEL